MIKKVIFIFVVVFVTAGCASSQSSGDLSEEKSTTKDDIDQVLTHLFSGPGEEVKEHYENGRYDEINTYYTDKFKPYFTEDYMNRAMKTNLLTSYHQRAFRSNVKMEVENRDIQQSDVQTDYIFDYQVNVSNGETAEVRGRVNTNEDGEITRIYFTEGQALVHAFDTVKETADGFYEYDHSTLEERASDEAYQPQYPEVMPFEVDGVEIKPGTKEQKDKRLTFVFHGETGESLTLTTMKGGDLLLEGKKTEDLSVGDLTAQYAVDKYRQYLKWTVESITYKLEGHLEGLSKDDLIHVADSFR
ncbi:DUF4367 domain-containing protein [Halobacillus litoralis]|uniref:DUF4367 domain-containing protein n=1 Tax=Halobacillus litoralis TaxID=45668 RepID=A0A845DR06_9BACI|nr:MULTISPECIES: DUF4367 domain-containing protein [Halobacillus]MYL19618.1 DUF4367 domain-containing protein [Halobacillus litoralis]MYL28764.1 DUF4367 domain-containing protein [Halobacillus halophilus]